ncbi:VWA domain-containing protein [Desulfococcus sp.]|uniref:vWA domain-containing protein n=1 Tax=Desulfococcus sp. TaxID=2025834 RepID=UPI003593D665
MKWQRVLAAVVLGLLMWRPPVTAQGLYFGSEGLLVPSENSQSVFDPLLSLKNAQAGQADRIDVFPDASGFPEIVVTMTIQDANGKPVLGLRPEDVILTEQSDDESIPFTETPTCFEAITSKDDVSFALALDVSYSMSENNKLTEAKAAAKLFLDAAGEDDRGAVVSFAGCKQVETVFPLAPITQDSDGNGTPDIRERIDELTALGSTAVYDGISQAVAALAGAAASKGIVALSDGMTNNDCTDTINSVIEKARAAGVPVYTIGLEIPADSTMAKNLETIADQTGGYFSLAPTPGDLAEIYLEIAGAIRAQYRICYTTHNPALDGTTRTVTVSRGDAAGSGTYTVGTLPGNRPPVIAHDPVTRAVPKTSVRIEAGISDPDPGDAIEKAALFFRKHADGPDAPFTEIPMTAQVGGEGYAAVIPASEVAVPGVDYYLSAWDTTGARTYSGRPESPYVIAVTDQAANQPPSILHDPVTGAEPGAPVTIEARISDPDDAVALATLFYRRNADAPAAPFTEISMAVGAGGNLYSAVIPGSLVDVPGVDYFISAWDETGDRADSGTPENPYFIRVTRLPVADAGPDQTVEENEAVTLDGSASSSAIEGEAPQFSWRQAMGPVVSLTGASTARPTFTAPAVDLTGTVLIFELTVKNSLGEVGTDRVWVTIEKQEACKSGDCGSGSGGCFIETVSAAPGWLWGLFW